MANSTKSKARTLKEAATKRLFCASPPEIKREISAQASPSRVRAINEFGKVWANGTQLRYCFFNRSTDGQERYFQDGTSKFVTWKGSSKQRQMVRDGFEVWKDLGIGLEFEEISDRYEAEIRIGFMQGDGHWSFLGRDILQAGPNERTMNLDKDILGPGGFDTVLHEIGHTLALSHEHQNPNAGIVWNDDAVYAALAAPPNNWAPEVTYHNILRKLPSALTKGTVWDRNSIMHYPFEPGLIVKPEGYENQPLDPEPGLSPLDKSWILKLYPSLDAVSSLPKLKRFASRVIKLDPGEQFDAIYAPKGTDTHTIETFGKTDLVLTVFHVTPDGLRFLVGDDNAGLDDKASVELKLTKGEKYVVRTRLFFNEADEEFGLMVH